MGMPISPLPPVTPLPVLVKSSDSARPDGVGPLFNPKDPDISGLHVVSQKEAFSLLDRWKDTQPREWVLVCGIALLQRAQKDRDWSAFQKAIDSVQRWVPHWGDAEIAYVRGSKKWKEAAWAYSGLMSNLLQTARFIIWYSTRHNEVPRPGLYCPNWEAAVYAIVGMGHIHFCKKPGCGAPFIPRFFSPDKDNEQKYCSPAHANAHRVALSKANKKART